jgi:hypothetical protein
MSAFKTLVERAKTLITEYKSKRSDPGFSPKPYQDRAVKLIKDHETTKKPTDCDHLISTFKALVADNLLVGDDLESTTYKIVNRCIRHQSEERIDYALDILVGIISQDPAKNLLFIIISKHYKEKFHTKIKPAIAKIESHDDGLSVKNRLAFLIVTSARGKDKSEKKQEIKTVNALTRLITATPRKHKKNPGDESANSTQSQPAADASFNSHLTVLSKFKLHMIEIIGLINNIADIAIIHKLKAWFIQNPVQKSKIILEICCLLHQHQQLDKDCLLLFHNALNGLYLDHSKHWKIHEIFQEACTRADNQELYKQFEERKNQSHAMEIDEIESSADENDRPSASENLQGSLQSAKNYVEGLLQRALDNDLEAYNELKQLYDYQIGSGKKMTLLVIPEICLALAKAIETKPQSFQSDVTPDELRTQAKDLFERFLKGSIEREGLLVDIAQLIYDGEILGKNLFLARHLLESCKEGDEGRFKLTDFGKILLAKMCFNREGGLEELDKTISLLDSVTPEVLHNSPEALYILGECYFVKKRLGMPCNSPVDLWRHAASLKHPMAEIADKILTRFEFSFFQKDPITSNAPTEQGLAPIEDDLGNPDSDYEDDAHYRGSDSTTTADRDLTIDIITRVRDKTLGKLSEITAKNETELSQVKQNNTKKGAPKKKQKQETHASNLEKKILEDYADIVNDYNPVVRSAAKNISNALRPDYEALVHHAAKGELFKHLSRTDISYQLSQLRGMHCFNHLWPEAKVREFKRQVLAANHPLKKHPVYSAAVKEIAGVDSYYPGEHDIEAHLRLQQAARLLRHQMSNMKRATGEYVNHPSVTKTVPRIFGDRLLQAQQFYTAYYTKFKDDYLPAAAGQLAHKTLKTTQVPFVSTADIQSIHAVRYAVGDKVYGFDSNTKRSPDYDNNLEPKHRYVGFVYLSIHPVEDYHPETHHHVPSLAQDNFITILSHILYERENTFFSDMAANRIRHIQAIKFPSFSREFIKIMEHKYGLDNALFTAFKRAFEQSKDSPTQRGLIVMLLGEHMAAYHSMYLHHKARQKITADNVNSDSKKAVMLYRTQHGGFSAKNSRFFTPWPTGNEDRKRYKRVTHRIATFNTRLPNIPSGDESSEESADESDLAISAAKRSRPHNFIRGELSGDPIVFEVHPTGGNNNCGFYGLPIPYDREGVVKLLLDNSKSDELREKIAHEILSLLFSNVLSEEDYPSLSDYNSIAEAYAHPDEQADYDSARAKFLALATEVSIFAQFVTSYIGGRGEISFTVTGDTLYDGHSLLDAIVDLLELHLVIWQRGVENTEHCVTVYNRGDGGQIHHLLHTRGLDTHFELLSVRPKNQLQFDDAELEAEELSSTHKKACY